MFVVVVSSIPKEKKAHAHMKPNRAYDNSWFINVALYLSSTSQGERRHLDSDSGLFSENRVYLQTPHGFSL
jgi:hypothetical protein